MLDKSNSWIRLVVAVGLIASLGVAGSAFAQSAPVVRVEPTATTISQGQVVTIQIRIDNVTNLGGAEIHLAFNSNVLEVIDADPAQDGVQIANGGMLSPDFTASNSADNSLGTIDYDVTQVNHAGVNGSGILAIISFRGKAVGVSPITFRGIQAAPTGVVLGDAGGTAISSTTQSGSVTVSAGDVTLTPTPTPSVTPTGTIFTPTPTLTPSPTSTPGGGVAGKHVVRAGETLYCIGRAYGVSPWAIASVNGIYAPYRLYIGRVLTIPNVPWTNVPAGPTCPRQFQGTPPAVTVTPPPPVGCRAIHVVVPGDTLYAISRKYGVNLWTLGAVNNIYNLNLIYVGQRLCIP